MQYMQIVFKTLKGFVLIAVCFTIFSFDAKVFPLTSCFIIRVLIKMVIKAGNQIETECSNSCKI